MKIQRTAALPVALVLTSLAGLVIAPGMIQRRVDAISSDISHVLDPARTTVTRILGALSLGVAATRGFLLTGHPDYAAAGRQAQDERARAHAELESLIERLPAAPPLRAELSRMDETIRSADANVDRLFSGELTPAGYLTVLPAQQTRFEVTTAAAQRIDELLAMEIGLRRDSIRTLDRIRVAMTAAFVLVAFCAVVLVARNERRYRIMARRMEDAAEERGRLLKAESLARMESETARRESQHRRAELERVMDSRAALIRGFSHDVKNPLNAAAGYLQLLGEGVVGPLTEKQKQSVDRAGRSLGAALKLIEDLLSLARAETIEVDRKPTDVRMVVNEVAQAALGQVQLKNLSLSLELPAEFPTIDTDPTRVRQVLANLVSNAVKYTTSGGMTLRTACRRSGDRTWAVVDVVDTGPGIPKEQQPMVFDEFRRLSAERSTSGAGIGLAISQRLAHLLGGRITVESKPGSGSTFSFWLPIQNDQP